MAISQRLSVATTAGRADEERWDASTRTIRWWWVPPGVVLPVLLIVIAVLMQQPQIPYFGTSSPRRL